MVITFIISLITSIGSMSLNIMFQQEVPVSLMGRIGSVMSAGCMASIPLGQMVFGILFDKVDTWMCVSVTAIILLVTSLVFKKALCSGDETTDNESLSLSSSELACAVNEDEH